MNWTLCFSENDVLESQFPLFKKWPFNSDFTTLYYLTLVIVNIELPDNVCFCFITTLKHKHCKWEAVSPGDSLVHQALLQRISQPLMNEGVADECSTLPQRSLQLEKQKQT